MPIFIRCSGTDQNPAGPSTFVSIPVPSGVTNGDILLVGINIPATGITITPPNDDWTLVGRTDASVAPGLAVYWKLALNEVERWVFTLSSSIKAVGTVVAYGNADPFSPIEVFAAALTTSSSTHTVAAVTADVDAEDVLIFLGTDAVGTYTPPSGFVAVTSKSQS